jgi:hypothetical protein
MAPRYDRQSLTSGETPATAKSPLAMPAAFVRIGALAFASAAIIVFSMTNANTQSPSP